MARESRRKKEKRKKKFRENMITSDDLDVLSLDDEDLFVDEKKKSRRAKKQKEEIVEEQPTQEMEVIEGLSERELAEIRRAEKEARARKIRIGIRVAIVVAILVGIFFLVRLISSGVEYDSYEVVSTEAVGGSGDALLHFKGGLIRYSTSGIKYTDEDGEIIWDQGFTMKNPKSVLTEDYGIIYDEESTGIVLFTKSGIEANYNASAPIAKAALSNYGVVAAMTQDANTSSIIFYDNVGAKLDVEVRNVLAKDSGYPISMTLSPDGQGLVLSLMFLDQGSMKDRISFLNFTEGKDQVDRVVGFFEYEDDVYPEVDYLNSDRVVAFGTNKIVFYSTANAASPKVKEEIECTEEIKSVFTGNEHAGVISKATEGGYKLTIYDDDGDVELEELFAFDYTKAEISENYVLIYGSGNALIATTEGHVKYNGPMDGTTSTMVAVSGNRFLQCGSYGVRTIELD